MSETSFTVQRLSPLRKVIAARMTDAKQSIPHFRLVADIEVGALLALRAKLNASEPTNKISVNDCLIKACALALMEVPAVNIQLVKDEVHQYHQADISVVMAVKDGLVTPIVRNAHNKNVQQIASEMRELSSRALAGRLKTSEIEGGSFSMSNLGMYEVDQFDAIINPPQCAILAVGRAMPRVTVSEAAKLRIATVLRTTLSIDHRAIDGATAAAFLTRLRQAVEGPERILR